MTGGLDSNPSKAQNRGSNLAQGFTMTLKLGIVFKSVLSCLISALLFLLPLWISPSQALAIECPAEMLMGRSDPNKNNGYVEVPNSALVCAQYGENAIIQIITPLRPSNLAAGDASSQVGDPDLQIIWFCKNTQSSTGNIQVFPGTCQTNSNPPDIADPYAAYISFDYSTKGPRSTNEEILYTTQITSSNVIHSSTKSPHNAALPETEITEDEAIYGPVKTVVAVCSDGSFVRPPTPCRRRA